MPGAVTGFQRVRSAAKPSAQANPARGKDVFLPSLLLSPPIRRRWPRPDTIWWQHLAEQATGQSSCRVSGPRRDVSALHAFAATPLLFSTLKVYLFKLGRAGGAVLKAHCAGDHSSECPQPQLCLAGSYPEGPSVPQSIFGPCSGDGILKKNTSRGHEEQRRADSVPPPMSGRPSQKHRLIIL